MSIEGWKNRLFEEEREEEEEEVEEKGGGAGDHAQLS